MVHKRIGTSKSFILPLLILVLLAAVACGSAGQPDTSAPDQPAAQKDAPKDQPAAPKDVPKQAVPTAVPAAKAQPTEAPAMALKPEGTINVGLKEMGPFFIHPSVMTNPQIFVQGTAPIGEGLLQQDINREMQGQVAESWSISDDFLTWTFKLNKGVQFHKGYGEMTSEDVVYSLRGFATSKHPRAGQLATFWEDRPGSSTPDDYTVVVNTGEPVVDLIAMSWHWTPGGGSTYIVSKKQSEEIGVDAAKVNIAATGPWEIVDHKTAEFWRMEAVEDHWRQTPFFKELVFWEIPEESSRIAGFQTGTLDTFLMSFDTISLVEKIEGATTMSVPNAVQMRLRIYGNWYPVPGIDEPRPGYDPELPWVSSTPDVTSEEWARAVKVRKALMTAIDRDGLVESILGGRGHTDIPLAGYTDFLDYLGGRDWPAFDPDGAKALLAEAGYPDGFSITLTPSIRGAAAEVEGCEIIAQMWNDVGLDVKFQRIPYGTLRPQLVGRTYQGATCHAGSPLSTPARGYGSYLSANPFNRGLEMQYTEDLMLAAQKEVDPVKRNALEKEIGIFLLDNALTDLTYYTMDAVWPVGPRLEAWGEFVKTTDVRQINGYEFIQHRK